MQQIEYENNYIFIDLFIGQTQPCTKTDKKCC